MKHRSTTLYQLYYETPSGSVKNVLWRGKDEAHASRSWQELYAYPITIIKATPRTISWKQ